MIKPAENGQSDHLTIKGRLPGLNEYIDVERTNRFAAAKMKREFEQHIGAFIYMAVDQGTLHSHDKPCELIIKWFEPNRRRDLDNISFATKFIQDALVKCGVFPDDNSKYIRALHHTYHVDTAEPRIEITIREEGNND